MKKFRRAIIFSVILILAAACILGGVLISNSMTGGKKDRMADNITDTEKKTVPDLNTAKKAMDVFLTNFYVKEGDGGYIAGEDFWQQAEIFEIVIDAYEQTKDKKYLDLMDEMYRGFVKEHGSDWSSNEFNDDIMWMTIGCARAYEATGQSEYLEQARKHFKIVFDRAWSEDLGGGLFWKTENKTKNSCINCPAVIAACLLHKITGEDEYIEKALMIYKWEKENLFGTTGAVFDAYDLTTGVNQWASTYNQGTFIGAAMMLYQYSKDESYLKDAVLAADYTVNTMFSGQIMNTEGDGRDLPGFKGILARWMGKFVRECGQDQYKDWLEKNAQAAWNNRNTKGIMWTLWNQKTEDTFYSAWGCSAGVSMLFNWE
ncbi:glycoside hydrolase family 76 protein [Anaerocolumna xylanovorans]|uniref:Predicted alpha-1,6-mannanase, GH76 family n=1 Tax=Anaerocolumna xylanovorans DSM 12503 TaxID=1121345 RepID=A0A1M7Y8F4_9FIRM|nr:glycoside hydrolase family 76 protein [Anaerocolumna xylanovorans]SHO48900.1 Predicted alpha-1,6-mannanase, GH76 family [Anaerocolumna xylanovorans DSM 12503]